MSILQNISLIILIAVIYHFIARKLRGQQLIVSLLNGALFGFAAVMAMLLPFRFFGGIIYDGRTIILAISGLFGGPIVAGIATVIAFVFRFFFVGGSGRIVGVITIIMASGIGLMAFYWRRRTQKPLNTWRILAISYIVHILMLLAQLLLPDQRWKSIIPVIALPVLFFYPLAFFLICKLFIDNEEREKSQIMLEESEARYKLLFQNHRSIMLLIEQETGGIVDANPAAEAFYGWTREELLSKNIFDINTLPHDQVMRKLKEAITQSNSTFLFKHRIASGDIRDVEVFAGPIEYFGKKLMFSIIHDASARIKAENEVRELNQSLEQQVAKRTEELQETNKELEAFAYSVSHDLRAPLRALEGFATLLSEEEGGAISESSKHYIERIRYNAKKMSQLIEDLLRLSRVARQTLEYSTVDLSRLARETADEMTARFPDRKVSVSIQDNMTAWADRALMEQVLINLFGNAWKFTSSLPEASIEFKSMDSDNERVYCVRDNGVGFDMAYADKLFTPFHRLHSEQEYGGSGIGLSIVRRIVGRHGGRVWAEASPNDGATFYFTLGGP
ncbi:MAG TPA: ATP-binding protein [Rectinemataceae bacterium]|nr:ATP-binding protein [Rectinemataceae bacterium]